MTLSGIPPLAAQLIADHIDSVEQLELLLWVHRLAPEARTAEDAAMELRVDVRSARRRLHDLTRSGFLTVDENGFTYVTSDHDTAVRALAEAWRDRRTSVITSIFSKNG